MRYGLTKSTYVPRDGCFFVSSRTFVPESPKIEFTAEIIGRYLLVKISDNGSNEERYSFGSVLREQIVNKVMFFLAPKFLGSSDGIPMFGGKGPKLIKDAFELKNMNVSQFDDDILVQGYL